MMMLKSYGRNFWITCLSMLFFMISFNLIIPELNDFLTNLKGGDKKGLIITLFTISAAISRPFSGKLADIIGRKRVMLVGMLVTLIVCLLYPLSYSVFFFLSLRFLHGFSAGFYPTGATALLTDILPAKQRGQGMGIWGTFISLGIGVGQGLGSIIANNIGIDSLFIIASASAAVSGILLIYVQESLPDKIKFKRTHLLVSLADVFEVNVLPAAVVMFLSAFCSGIIFVLSPDISNYLGISNKGWFFIFYVISTIGIRLFLSSLSDKIGRRKTLAIAMVLLIISMLMIGFAKDIISYTLASIIFGVATGLSSPTIFAWTADLSHPARRGVGSGTMFIALELGIMAGSFSTMLIYDSTFESVPKTFLLGLSFAAIALSYLIWHLNKRSSAT
jgi:MFS family permease